MDTDLNTPIVVGVDGSPDSGRALRFAVRRAEQVGCGLLLVNAVHEMVPISTLGPLIGGESLMDVGREVLADAVRLVEKTAGTTMAVQTHVALGPAVSVLAAAAVDARLVVIGHRPGGTLEHLFTGTTTFGVVARARCPVVSVPRGWDGPRPDARVIAAVDGSATSTEVLAHAFELAATSSAELHVVHCWKLGSLYAYLVDDELVQKEWGVRTAEVIATFVDECAADHPDVHVTTHLEYADPTRALVRRSADADVLVLGRHDLGAVEGRLALAAPGSIARALVQHARCPVEFVPLDR
ncbi:universal stress protein [Sanguibacter sp. 25GB23B1]|uniref:universal stress protein n=1 Tax=unclassified Sanguibacter TaxID=2645534 RepID=UPI0032AEAD78